MNSDGFTKRIVSYQYIHSIEPESYEEMLKAIDSKEGETVLEAACGYGDVSEKLLKQVPVELFLLDNNEV